MGRAPCCDRAKVRRGSWSLEEDAVLKDYLQKNGTGGSWISLPQKAGLKRCGKSCRLRWLNYLRPDIKHGGFTAEEDDVILTLYANIGSRWSIIASHLPGRTDNDVKNHWNTKLKKKLMAGTAAFPTPATAAPDNTATYMNFPASSLNQVHDQGSMDVILQAYPEVGPDHWLYQLSNDQFALPGLSEAQQNGTRFDALFSASSLTTTSVAKSCVSWSDNVEEMESKSSGYFDVLDYYAGSVPGFFDIK